MQTSFGKTIVAEFTPSTIARLLTVFFHTAGIAAVLLSDLPIGIKILLLIVILSYIFIYWKEQRKGLHIKQLRIHPNQSISIRDIRGRTRPVTTFKFAHIICYYLTMHLQIENESEKRIYIFGDMTDADTFRELRAFAISTVNSLSLHNDGR